ncbi:MAG: histidinol-phosphatase [Bacilli bacterium]
MQRKLDYCYHSHTTRCGHAYGTDEAYVQAAIANGFKVIGFSDHIFFPGISQPGMRGEYSQLEDYKQSVNQLKQIYAKQIQVHLGFEAEYYSVFDDYYRDLKTKHGFEYLIIGQHFRLVDRRFPIYYASVKDPALIHEYADSIIAAMKTGLFSYVAHPDLYMLGYAGGWDEHAQAVAKKLAEASVQYDVPLELNLGGVNGRGLMMIHGEYRYPYPYEPFWQVVKQAGATTILGLDAHAPDAYQGNKYQLLFDIVDKYQLKTISRLTFK